MNKGHLISKANCQAEDSSKKRTNEFVFTSMRRVFVPRPVKNVSRLSDLYPPFENPTTRIAIVSMKTRSCVIL